MRFTLRMSSPTEALIRYRPWRGEPLNPIYGSLAMARLALIMLLRRKLFWALYAIAGLVFFFFFYGQYIIVWIQMQTASQSVQIMGGRMSMGEIVKFLDQLQLNGSGFTFSSYIWFQGYVGMIILALAGSILVGNDFHHGSLPFYLSKPISRWHYILGKCLGIGLFINLLTTLPAIVLFLQAGLLYDWQAYYLDHWRDFFGILAYGSILTITLSLVLVATSVWLRRTVPLIMVWAGIFVLCRLMGGLLVNNLQLDPSFKLIDLWNNLYLLGLWSFGLSPDTSKGNAQPHIWQAALTVGIICTASTIYLRRRIQAVEIVS
jgi:ABC-2 type transport system permease protein